MTAEQAIAEYRKAFAERYGIASPDDALAVTDDGNIEIRQPKTGKWFATVSPAYFVRWFLPAAQIIEP
jgi:hypothetical protein